MWCIVRKKRLDEIEDRLEKLEDATSIGLPSAVKHPIAAIPGSAYLSSTEQFYTPYESVPVNSVVEFILKHLNIQLEKQPEKRIPCELRIKVEKEK